MDLHSFLRLTIEKKSAPSCGDRHVPGAQTLEHVVMGIILLTTALCYGTLFKDIPIGSEIDLMRCCRTLKRNMVAAL